MVNAEMTRLAFLRKMLTVLETRQKDQQYLQQQVQQQLFQKQQTQKQQQAQKQQYQQQQFQKQQAQQQNTLSNPSGAPQVNAAQKKENRLLNLAFVMATLALRQQRESSEEGLAHKAAPATGREDSSEKMTSDAMMDLDDNGEISEFEKALAENYMTTPEADQFHQAQEKGTLLVNEVIMRQTIDSVVTHEALKPNEAGVALKSKQQSTPFPMKPTPNPDQTK